MSQGGAYFTAPAAALEFIPSGCKLLDCTLAGGWPLGRIVNIVGDRSTGKTLLAMEALANFISKYPKGKPFYRETESAFDSEYAKALGIPMDQVDMRGDLDTVEQLHDDLEHVVNKAGSHPSLYVLDCLDALSDTAEMERKIGDGSYGAAKAKKLSELFRRLVRKLSTKKVCVIIISQVRDNIGVMFGEKHSRSGGKALDFYASVVLWLAKLKTLSETQKGVKRATGIRILANCKKNKIGLPFRRCEFGIRFGYGIEDVRASLEWLDEVKRLDMLDLTKDDIEKTLADIERLEPGQAAEMREEINQVAETAWYEIERDFLPPRRKYG